MTTETGPTCTAAEFLSRRQTRSATVIDVREYPEWAAGHVAGSRLVPLSDLRRNPGLIEGAGEVFLICGTGRRATEAADLLRRAGRCAPVVVLGGIEALREAGVPMQRERGPISLERQVRIAAGSLVLAGLLFRELGFLPYVVGAGLIFAGVTNSCAMGLLLARLPWNRPRREAARAR